MDAEGQSADARPSRIPERAILTRAAGYLGQISLLREPFEEKTVEASMVHLHPHAYRSSGCARNDIRGQKPFDRPGCCAGEGEVRGSCPIPAFWGPDGGCHWLIRSHYGGIGLFHERLHFVTSRLSCEQLSRSVTDCVRG